MAKLHNLDDGLRIFIKIIKLNTMLEMGYINKEQYDKIINDLIE